MEFWDLDGGFVVERDVRSKEVVMGGKENDKRQGSIIRFKAAGRADMEFKGSVEPFNELLEGSVGFGLLVEVLQSNDFVRDIIECCGLS